jgi:hypothetical protein
MSKPLPRIGPESRMIDRGLLDGRSTEGRFLRSVEAQLAAHIGGAPNFVQKILIRRAARGLLKLELLDREPALTEHGLRTSLGLENRVRLCLRELGIDSKVATDAKVTSLADIIAKHDGKKAGALPPGSSP